MGLKEGLKKFWNLIWKDDSWKGWIISIIVLFIFIKFIFFPTLSLVTGTALPMAIVESCSMYHEENVLPNYKGWWESHKAKYSDLTINREEFTRFIFHNGFNKGDILFVIKANPEKLKIGDVIIFNGGKQNPLVHRIIKIENKNNEYFFSTIGDNNNGQLEIEKEIKQEQLVGKAIFKIAPYMGWAKLIFYEYLKNPSERGMCKQN
jgi:signal peptidase I